MDTGTILLFVALIVIIACAYLRIRNVEHKNETLFKLLSDANDQLKLTHTVDTEGPENAEYIAKVDKAIADVMERIREIDAVHSGAAQRYLDAQQELTDMNKETQGLYRELNLLEAKKRVAERLV